MYLIGYEGKYSVQDRRCKRWMVISPVECGPACSHHPIGVSETCYACCGSLILESKIDWKLLKTNLLLSLCLLTVHNGSSSVDIYHICSKWVQDMTR